MGPNHPGTNRDLANGPLGGYAGVLSLLATRDLSCTTSLPRIIALSLALDAFRYIRAHGVLWPVHLGDPGYSRQYVTRLDLSLPSHNFLLQHVYSRAS